MTADDLGQTPATPAPVPAGSEPPPPPPGLFPEPGAQTAPPAPQAGAIGAAQAQTASPAPDAPVSAERPKKKGRGCWIAAIIVVVIGCMLCGIVAAVFGFAFMGNADTATITQAETHYAAATTALGAATTLLGDASSNAASARIKETITKAETKLRAARDELSASKVSIERIKDSQGKTDYLDSILAATAAIDSLEDVVAYLGTVNEMLARVQQALDSSKKANTTLNLAIESANSNDYALMKSRGKSASQEFTKAVVVFQEAAKLDPTAGLTKTANYANLRRQQADIVVLMADYGVNHKASAYNKEIAHIKTIDKQIAKLGDPAIISDPNRAKKRLAAIGAKSSAEGKKADELHVRALKELKYQPPAK